MLLCDRETLMNQAGHSYDKKQVGAVLPDICDRVISSFIQSGVIGQWCPGALPLRSLNVDTASWVPSVLTSTL